MLNQMLSIAIGRVGTARGIKLWRVCNSASLGSMIELGGQRRSYCLIAHLD